MSPHVVRALAIAAYRAGDSAGGDAALARIAGAESAAARAMLAAMHGLDGTGLVTRVRRELSAARPAHWRTIHATWLDELLGGEGPAVRAAVLSDDDTRHARHLARAFLGSLWPMPDPATVGGKGVTSLLGLDPERLARTIIILGRRQLAHALTGTPRDELGALALRLPWGKELVADVAVLANAREQAELHLGRQTSAMARMRDIHVASSMGPARIGLRALAPSVARIPQLADQLVQRLSRPFGLLAKVDLRFLDPSDGVDDVEIAAAIARASVGAA